MAQRKVDIRGNTILIEVYQKSQTVWVASGAYLGKSFEVKGRSASSAVNRWRDAATYYEPRGDDMLK